jgi:biopolymer transport protein TolR
MAMGGPSSSGSSRRRRRGRSRGVMSEINVTPLVDVMLVLLIIFMVTAPLLNNGVPIELPESAANPLPSDAKPVEVSIDPQGIVYIGEDAVSDTDLRARFMELAELQNEPGAEGINLRGDTALQYGRMMQVMGEMNAAGITKIGLVTTGSSGAE